MSKPVYDLLNAEVIGAYVENVSAQRALAEPFYGESLFPSRRTNKRDISYYKTQGKREIAIKPSAFDANAPLMPRGTVSKITESLPFFRMGDLFSEIDIEELNALLRQGGNESLIQSLQINIMGKPEKLYRSALIQLENMRWQLLTQAKIVINANAQDGQPVSYEYNFDADGSWAGSNVTTLQGNKTWVDANLNTAFPLDDIASVAAKSDDVGGIYMNKNTFNALAKIVRPQMVTKLLQGVTVTSADIKNQVAVAGEEAPLTIYNKWFTNEMGKKKTYIPDGYVVFTPTGVVGETVLGPTPEELVGQTNAFDSNVVLGNGVSLAQWVSPHPVKYNLAVSMLGMPICPRQDEVFVLKAY